MRASWNGYISLGNLKVPVQLFSAIRDTAPQFVQVHATDHAPIRRVAKCSLEDKEIHQSEIVRAVESGDSYIEVTDSEVSMIGDGDKVIAVRQFSDQCAINPKYYDKPYYIAPSEGGEYAYTLLRQAFIKANKIAIATYIYYQKQHLGMIFVDDGMLMLQQLRFATELVPRTDIKTSSLPQPSPPQIDIAMELMQRYSTPLYIEDYRNEHEDRVNELVQRKVKGLPPKRQKVVAPEVTSEEHVIPILEELLHSASAKSIRNAS